MNKEDVKKAQDEGRLIQQKITNDWKAVAAQYPHLIEDFELFTKGIAGFYRQCAEDQEMYEVPLDDHKIASLLQQARTCDMVRTYITSRIDQDVAQPIKKSK